MKPTGCLRTTGKDALGQHRVCQLGGSIEPIGRSSDPIRLQDGLARVHLDAQKCNLLSTVETKSHSPMSVVEDDQILLFRHSQQVTLSTDVPAGTTGYLGALTPSEAQRLGELEEAVQEFLRSQHTSAASLAVGKRDLLRFLRATRFSVSKAKRQLFEALQLRQRLGIDHDASFDQFTMPPPLGVDLLASQWFRTRSHDGHIVLFDRLGRLLSSRVPRRLAQMSAEVMNESNNNNSESFWSSKGYDDLFIERIFAWHLEYLGACMRRLSAEAGAPRDTLLYVTDMRGLTVAARRALWLVRRLVSMLQLAYPEYVLQILVINCPRIFPALFNLVKPLFNENTRSKMQLLSHGGLDLIKSYVPEENIPVDFGGRFDSTPLADMAHEQPCCRPRHCWIPQVFAGHGVRENWSTQSVTVSAGTAASSALRDPAEMQATEGNADALQVPPGAHADYFVQLDSKDVPVKVEARSHNNTSRVIFEGNITDDDFVNRTWVNDTESNVTLHLLVDNTKSRWTSKTLRFAARLTPSTELCVD